MPIEAESRGRTTRTSKHTPTAWRRSNVKERNLSATFDRIASDASPSADIGNKSNVAALHETFRKAPESRKKPGHQKEFRL